VEEEPTMEQAIVSAVTDDTSEAKVTVHGVPDEPGVAASLFGALADQSINIDMIVQNTPASGVADISFTVAKVDLARTTAVCDEISPTLGASSVSSDDSIGRVSLVGAGMKSHPGVTARMFKTLADEGINIEMISTSSIRISCVIRAELVEDAVRSLHEAFKLGAAP
jgi:aspartate kinase